MRKEIFLFLMCLLSLGNVWANLKVRSIEMTLDQVAQIKTAVGVATIIEVPDPPNSVVIGNPEAFKVEYLDRAITLRPVSNHSKTNLYIYTDYRRFNVELVAGDPARSDYVVYLKNPTRKILSAMKNPTFAQRVDVKWKNYVRSVSGPKFVLKVKRVGMSGVSSLIDFEVSSKTNGKIDPKIFWIKQGKKTITVQAILLSRLDYDPKHKVQGLLEIKNKDINENLPFILELKEKAKVSLTLRRISKWKDL
jgi:hypothetical protein